MMIWKQWRRIRAKLKNLITLWGKKIRGPGVGKHKKKLATNGFLLKKTTITTDKFKQSGYVFSTDHYQRLRLVN